MSMSLVFQNRPAYHLALKETPEHNLCNFTKEVST